METANKVKRVIILAIDPGRQKFGYAVLQSDKTLLEKGVAEAREKNSVLERIFDAFPVDLVVMGDKTGSKDFQGEIDHILRRKKIRLFWVDEDSSSREGRYRYLLAHRKGWRRFLPLGLQSPPEPYDDYVAVVLGERYLNGGHGW